MALIDSVLRAKDKVSSAVSNFFYPRDEYPQDERTMTRRERRAPAAPRREEYDYPQAEDPRQEAVWSEPQVRESSPYQNTNPYQSPAQPQTAGYPLQGAPQPQAAAPQGYAPQYQAPQQAAPDQAAQGQDGSILFFPNAPQGRETAVRVITARSVADCYSAITQLRLGDTVILVMDSITDPAEMRHYVDMLSGACYSLRATITKLSRHGAYLVCPSQVRVYVDAATNQLNSAARQPQRPAQGYQPRVPQGGLGYSGAYGAPGGGFDPARRMPQADPYAAGGSREYYSRSAMADAQGTADHLQPHANGYMPDSQMDEMRAQ